MNELTNHGGNGHPETRNGAAHSTGTLAPQTYVTPSVDVFEKDDSFLVVCDLPGVRRESLKLDFQEGLLSLEASRPASTYRRVLRFDADLDVDAISAQFENGTLRVHVPKGERARPRRIPITVKS